ncbi:hypothetical protein GEV33_008857 [Tenebrio molitor]|uniref:DH domain-containing protein n=1 Tax=Tenebrio molitor TaxID=7067 RepID=A0A8J6HFX7_TENMO|nr:hypothetical protein GEV33_008857 [Tenebrio molitor]
MEALFRKGVNSAVPLVAPGEAKGPRVSSPGAGPVRQSEKKKGRKEQTPKSDSHSKKKDPFMERGERNEDNIRQKNCDLLSRHPEIPIELGFPKVRYPARNGEPHNSSDGHRRLREDPENWCETQENAATKFTQSRRKTDLNGCRQKENREPTDACVLEFSIEIVSRCSGRRRESSMEEAVKREEDRKERNFSGAGLALRQKNFSGTVATYRPAEILRKKTRFQLPLQLRPNVKNEEKPTRKIQREGKVKGLTTTTSERDGEGSGKRDTNKTVASKEQYRCLDEDEQKEKKEKENEEESTDDMFGSNDFDEDHDDNYILEAYNKEGSELIITTLQITRRSMRQDEAEDIEKLISTSHFVFEEVEYENFDQNDTSSPESEVFYENVRKTSDKSISSKQTNVLDSNITENLSDVYDSDIYEEVHYDECDSSCNKQIKQRIQYRNLSTFGLRSSSEKREHGDNYYYSLNHFSDSDDALAQQEENTEQTSEPTSPTEASGKKEKINYVIEEMTKTEELYIAGLKIVVENYMPYLAKHTPQDLLGKDTYIFGNILLIYKKAQEFFALLQKDGKTADSIADLFIASVSVPVLN